MCRRRGWRFRLVSRPPTVHPAAQPQDHRRYPSRSEFLRGDELPPQESQHQPRIAHPFRNPLPVEPLQQWDGDLAREPEVLLELADVDGVALARGYPLARGGERVAVHVDAFAEAD